MGGKHWSQVCQPQEAQNHIECTAVLLVDKSYYVKVLLKRVHLNGHTIGYCVQTQKVEQHTESNSTM